jgi:hypothetical protein
VSEYSKHAGIRRNGRSVSAPIRTRPWASIIPGAGGLAVGASAFLTWFIGHGSRPTLGVEHTGIGRLFVYKFTNDSSFTNSVGIAMLLLASIMVIGALTQLRFLIVLGAVAALGMAGMWIAVISHHFLTPHLPNIHDLNPAHLAWGDLRAGAWLALGGAALGVLSALWLVVTKSPTKSPTMQPCPSPSPLLDQATLH